MIGGNFYKMAEPNNMVIYDGDCNFCRRSAEWLKTQCDVRTMADNEIDLSVIGLTSEDTKTSVWWIEGSIALQGHKAIAKALKTSRKSWKLFAKIIEAPLITWISAIVYKWVANNRHRLG
tara:strand:+ start:69 stop:428 length:360 start_codon:yes stop_codon:yes gene_type:complete